LLNKLKELRSNNEQHNKLINEYKNSIENLENDVKKLKFDHNTMLSFKEKNYEQTIKRLNKEIEQ
jgi:CII-binding regulator of phage lambda lysogenization HflD